MLTGTLLFFFFNLWLLAVKFQPVKSNSAFSCQCTFSFLFPLTTIIICLIAMTFFSTIFISVCLSSHSCLCLISFVFLCLHYPSHFCPVFFLPSCSLAAFNHPLPLWESRLCSSTEGPESLLIIPQHVSHLHKHAAKNNRFLCQPT